MQKRRQRKRLRFVDSVVATVTRALSSKDRPLSKSIDRWHGEMPREDEMLARDKYTIFDRKERKYRKGIHSTSLCSFTSRHPQADLILELPKWTRVSQRLNPPGF